MERNRGLDLLRLLAGMAVVMLHYNYGYVFQLMDNIPTANRMLLYGMEALCVPAVNVFMLISGFFLFRTDKRSLGKVLNLFIMIIIFRELFYIGPVALGRHPFEWDLFLRNLVPNLYFIVLYSVVYLVSPYLNMVIRRLSSKGVLRLLLILFILLSLEPWQVDVLEKNAHDSFRGMNMVSFSGADGGQSLVHFAFMYIIGASLCRLEQLGHKMNIKWGGVYLATTIIIFLTYTILSPWMGQPYYSPFVVIQAVALFSLFRKVDRKPFMSRLSKAALTCYIIHIPFLHFLRIDFFIQQPVYVLAIQIIASLIGIYLLAFVFMTTYDFIFKRPQEKLNQLKINYFIDD